MELYLRYLPIGLVLIFFVERMRELKSHRQTLPGERQETVGFNLFMFSGLIGIFGCIAEYIARGLHPVWLLTIPGVAAFLASFAIRRRAIAALGRFWSFHVEMREGHEFVQSGPFSRMRHPVYFSMILELFGSALILNAWVGFAVSMSVFIPTLIRRLRVEEAALLRQFGAAYEQYQRTTPMLIPWRRVQ